MNHAHVKIVVSGGSRVGSEEVPAERVGSCTWRLLRSPLYATEVAAGDVIRLQDEGTGEFEIVKRGGNVCVQLFLGPNESDDMQATSAVANAVLERIEPLGGRVDAQTAGLVVFTLPVVSGFAAIERVFKAAARVYPGVQWQYANVYHPVSGEPLRWWEA
jgi:hypothetical protein